MNLLLTGGAGFIASNFSLTLKNDKSLDFRKVFILDSLSYAGNLNNLDQVLEDRRFEFVKGDICDRELVSVLMPDCDVVVNFAAESHVDRSINSRDEFVQTNIVGTQILLDSFLKNNREKFIQISTDEVYGSQTNDLATEEYNLSPSSPYAASKAAADLLVLAYVKTYGINACITRSSNNYGPRQHYEKLIPKTISNLMNGKKVPIYGDGRNIRNWIYVEDNCRAIIKVISHGKRGEIYNIAGQYEISNIDIVKQILEHFDLSEKFIEFVPDRPGHDYRYGLNGEKMRAQFGFEASTTFKSGLDATINWYKNNPNWWDIS
jgi:dTDP-glucose 4,6-dehydratase